MRKRIVITFAFTLCVSCQGAFALPFLINLHGRLMDTRGNPIKVPTQVDFALYRGGSATKADDGVPVYRERIILSPDPNGEYEYQIGSGIPLDGQSLAPEDFDTTQDVYLQLTIAGTALLPRLKFFSNSYAFVADTANNAHVAETVKPKSISADSIAEGAITGDLVKTGSLTPDLLVPNSLTSDVIKPHSITSDSLAASSISPDLIQPNSLTSGQIADAAISLSKLAPDSVDGSKIVDGSIGTNQLAAASVTNSKIAAHAVDGSKLQVNFIAIPNQPPADFTWTVKNALPIGLQGSITGVGNNGVLNATTTCSESVPSRDTLYQGTCRTIVAGTGKYPDKGGVWTNLGLWYVSIPDPF